MPQGVGVSPLRVPRSLLGICCASRCGAGLKGLGTHSVYVGQEGSRRADGPDCARSGGCSILMVQPPSLTTALGVCMYCRRGTVSGKLYIKDGPLNPWQDCSTTGMGGRAIPGSIPAIHAMGLRCSCFAGSLSKEIKSTMFHSLFFSRCTARYLLVIEKDAIFQALTQDRFFDELPCVMVTAKGMPDLATRAFCSKLVDACPGLAVRDSSHMLSGICGGALPSLSPTTHLAHSVRSRIRMVAHTARAPGSPKVLGLVDWNPSGCSILRTYKYGSGQRLEGSRRVWELKVWGAGRIGDFQSLGGTHGSALPPQYAASPYRTAFSPPSLT